MRVLINGLQAANRSGTGRYTTELIGALVQHQPAVQLAVVWPRTAAPGPWANRVELIPRSASALRRLWTDQAAMEHLRKAAGADLVHYPANIGPMLREGRAVLTVHDLSFVHHPEWFRGGRAWYYRLGVAASARRARRIIADSQATAADLRTLLDLPEAKVDVVPLGVNPQFCPAGEAPCRALRAQLALPDRFFLFVGTREPRKNLARVIDAWSRIAFQTPCDLVIAGRHGWKGGAVEAAYRRSQVQDRIHFPGYVDEKLLPALLSAADVFVWPSLYEGFGLPPLEAMACGTPVVTSNAASLPEVVGDAALMVDPYDTEALGEALLRLATDHHEADTLRDRGLARARAFTWERTAEGTVQSYHAAVAASH